VNPLGSGQVLNKNSLRRCVGLDLEDQRVGCTIDVDTRRISLAENATLLSESCREIIDKNPTRL
jgi:hypothetical protein